MNSSAPDDLPGDPAALPLPPVLAGPLLRHVSPTRVVFWLVATDDLAPTLRLGPVDDAQPVNLPEASCQRLRVGRHAVIHLIDFHPEVPLPVDTLLAYDLRIAGSGGETGIADYAPHLVYPDEASPRFVIKSRLDSVLHGSCRRPHHKSGDGLTAIDAWLAARRTDAEARPAHMLFTGDQVYADDVAGPVLRAIHALIDRLGLFDEDLEGAIVPDGRALCQAPESYYRRQNLLPAMESTATLRDRFFGGVEKPIFTTASADNHLITLAEILAMYLLVWSPVGWTLIAPTKPALSDEESARYDREQSVIDAFVTELPAAARVMAQIPTLMIFDDHDVTDDWNLSAEWEAAVYGHPFSRQIIGNALTGYLLCQAWGNAPDRVANPIGRLSCLLTASEPAGRLPAAEHDAFIDDLLKFEQWHFSIETTPKLVVLDTRTRRWRSELSARNPSGLMDWEALTELQQDLLGRDSVVVVSPAPMFGVKLIEGIQRLFTMAGHPLVVDAENWMAHRGAAMVMLNIFRHSKTPGRYVILSGDVHYSFVYDVRIRQRESGPEIWQITSSGIKNEFPRRLLDIFDRLNRWLYAPWSPLNWLTKRRRMEVSPRIPDKASASERLWNGSGVGHVVFDGDGRPTTISQIGADGTTVTFPPRTD